MSLILAARSSAAWATSWRSALPISPATSSGWLFLTDSFLIKGQVERKYARLSQLLDEYRKYFVKVRDATLVDLGTRERIQTPLLHMNVDEILLAHEYLDEAGDVPRAELAQEQEGTLQKVRVFYTGNLNVEIAGAIRPSAYEVSDKATRRFFVMHKPQVRGLDRQGDEELELIDQLPYAILNKTRLSYVYDFN